MNANETNIVVSRHALAKAASCCAVVFDNLSSLETTIKAKNLDLTPDVRLELKDLECIVLQLNAHMNHLCASALFDGEETQL